jgi:chemotaxis-related protein WspD
VTELFSSPAAQLLDREVPGSYVREWTDIVAAEKEIVETNFRSVLIFRIGSEWLALPTSVIKEIGQRSAVHRLPHRSGGIVQGIVSVRGEVLVCVALEALLGLHETSSEAPSGSQAEKERLIVCEVDDNRVAFVARAVHGVHRYLPRNLRDIPATVARSAATYTIGILPWKADQTVGCLDAELVFYALNKGLA